MLTVKDIARRWNVSPSWVYRRIHDGSLPYYRATERAIRIDGFEAEQWFEQHHHNKRKRKVRSQ
jgi:excisionase family DNA binding protein